MRWSGAGLFEPPYFLPRFLPARVECTPPSPLCPPKCNSPSTSCAPSDPSPSFPSLHLSVKVSSIVDSINGSLSAVSDLNTSDAKVTHLCYYFLLRSVLLPPYLPRRVCARPPARPPTYLDLDLAHITYRYSCGRGRGRGGLPDGSGEKEERGGGREADRE